MCEEVKENCHELNSIKYKTMLLQGEITSDTNYIEYRRIIRKRNNYE